MAECIDSSDYDSSIDLSHLSSSSDDDDVKEYELQGVVGKKPKKFKPTRIDNNGDEETMEDKIARYKYVTKQKQNLVWFNTYDEVVQLFYYFFKVY